MTVSPAIRCRIRTGDPKEDLKIVCPCIPHFRVQFAAMRKCWCGLFILESVEDGAEVERQQAIRAERLAAYEKAVFTALSEVDTGVSDVLKQAGLTGTTSEAMRMIEQGAVKLNGERVDALSQLIEPFLSARANPLTDTQ